MKRNDMVMTPEGMARVSSKALDAHHWYVNLVNSGTRKYHSVNLRVMTADEIREAWFYGGLVAVGDYVTVCMYSDRDAYEVVKVSKSGKQLTLHPVKATLLNGVSSGEKDALKFSPGGFVGHTSGVQRYSYEKLLHDKDRMSKANWSVKHSCFQTKSGKLIPGAHKHYDYNF